VVRARPDENGGLRVEVQDHGVGIAEEHHDQVFKQFTRVQSGDERVGHGRGVGLFVSKFFVESHGGSVGLQSEAGQGSTFWFTIPAHPPVDEAN
jgi:signal transduction histidine kinase